MIKTYSAFTYGHTVTDDNQWLNFSEDGITELSAQIDIGSYTLGTFAGKVAQALNEVGTLNYTCTVDRATLKLTISADSPFWLYVTTGTNASISAYNLMGFTTDVTNDNNVTGENISGSVYYPQFMLQQYVDFDENVKFNQPSVAQSASGKVEVVSFGKIKTMECEVTMITDKPQDGYPIKNNPNGYQDALDFLNYAITKAEMEFIRDADNMGTSIVHEVLLESTDGDSKGTGYRLRELYATVAPDYFSAGKLKFRELI